MSQQGISTQAVVMSYNTSTGAYVVGDAANITLKFIKDGSVTTPTNSVVEPSGAGLKGAYTLALTSAETQCQTLWVGGNSSSANTIIISITLTFTSGAVGPVTTTGTATANVSQWNGVAVQGFIPPDVSFTHASTAQAGTVSTITLDSSASRTDNFYLNQIVVLTAGSGAGQSAIINAYSGATQLATIQGVFATAPSPNTKFALQAFGAPLATLTSGVNVTQWLGATPNVLVSGLVATSTSGGSIGSVSGAVGSVTGAVGSVTGNVGGSVASITSGVNVTQWLGSPPNALVSGLVATSASGGSIGSVSGAVGSVTGAVGSVTGNVGGSVASVTSGVSVTQWNFVTVQGFIPPDTILTRFSTAQSGTTTSITLDSGASRTDNFYLNQIITLTAGSGAGESAIISAYSGNTQLATIVGNFAVAPSANTKFVLEGFGSVPTTISGGVNVTQWQGASVNNLVNGLVATSASGGSIGSVSGTVASVTSGVNVTQWLGSVPNVLVSGLVATSTSGGSIGSVSGAVNSVTTGVTVTTNNDKTGYSLTAGEETAISNAVWDNASGIETNVTPRQALRYIAAAETGITTGALTNTFTISAISASGTTRITAVCDSSGNRSSVTLS